MKLDCIPGSALKGRTATYARVATLFGPALLATSNGALCWLDFKKAGTDVETFARYWRGGTIQPHPGSLQAMADALFAGRHHNLTVLVAGDGSLHGFGCGLPLKEALLRAEGFTQRAA